MRMIQVRLPDGRTLEAPAGATVLDVAAQIGPRLARAALVGRVDGRLLDLRVPLEHDAALEIVTAKQPEGSAVIRHSAEHVMADAVKRLFPSAQIDVGRSDHAEKFQYDFLVDAPFAPDDLERIEAEMKRIVDDDLPFTRRVVSREAAVQLFSEQGEELKVSRIADIPKGEPITLYQHGEFVDLCRGPHVQHTGQIGAFKLTEVAGAYYRGDERNPMLQRIYGTAFASSRQLREYLERIEEAKRRDHRRLGAELDLFHIDGVAPGSPFYHPKGMVLYNGLVDFIRSLYPKYGFQEVLTPQLCRAELYQKSGHYEMFREDMFFMEGEADEELGLKATNCPGHCQLFSIGKHSYRDLPLRFAEFSRLHRNERSGTLTGLARVRVMAQDDGHIFCEPEQVPAELESFFEMTIEVYRALGLEVNEVYVSTRPEKFLGAPENWTRAENDLVAAVEKAGFKCGIKPGEAVFYAPKVEVDFHDVLGRAWTLATVQIDMVMPGRFGLRYVGSDGHDHQPAMLHRAVLGSLERFIALYIEHTNGDFPLWLAPLQARVIPITDRHVEYGGRVVQALRDAGVRADLDARNEKLGFKIREAEVQKVPVMLVVGDKEQKSESVAPRRRRGADASSEPRALTAVVAELAEEVRRRHA